MKTEKQSFIFRKKQVQQYIQKLGDSNPVYESETNAQKLGFQTIPISPAMPMTLYKSFAIPWMLQAPVILRNSSAKSQ